MWVSLQTFCVSAMGETFFIMNSCSCLFFTGLDNASTVESGTESLVFHIFGGSVRPYN